MNFTTPKLCSLLHQILDVLVVQDIAWDVDGLAAALVDLIGYRLALLYATQSVPASTPLASFSSPSPPPPLPPSPRIDVSCLPLTAIDIGYNDVGTLVRKQSRCFSSDALPGACNDGSLAGKHATGVVELRRHGEDGRVCNMQESSMKEEMYVWERDSHLHSSLQWYIYFDGMLRYTGLMTPANHDREPRSKELRAG